MSHISEYQIYIFPIRRFGTTWPHISVATSLTLRKILNSNHTGFILLLSFYSFRWQYDGINHLDFKRNSHLHFQSIRQKLRKQNPKCSKMHVAYRLRIVAFEYLLPNLKFIFLSQEVEITQRTTVILLTSEYPRKMFQLLFTISRI